MKKQKYKQFLVKGNNEGYISCLQWCRKDYNKYYWSACNNSYDDDVQLWYMHDSDKELIQLPKKYGY